MLSAPRMPILDGLVKATISVTTKPDVPELVVRPVANGYIVTVGSPRYGDGVQFTAENTHVATSYAALCRILKHVSVKAKLSQ